MTRFPELKERVGLEEISLLLAFLVVYFFIFALMELTPEMLASSSITTGGDMGSHYILAQYLRDYLLPNGKLAGWYPHWQGGLPMFEYYFVPPYLLMVFLSYMLSLPVAFKIVTLLWVFMLPLTVFFGMRAMGFKSPMPAVASSLSLLLLFLETVNYSNYSQWGGNIKSTLAGQFPYGISFALMFLSLGLLYKGYHEKKNLVLNSVLFSLVALNHIYTTIIIGLASTFFLLDAFRSKKLDGVYYLGKVFILGFLIAGFWYVPMASNLGWSSPPKDVFYVKIHLDWIFIREYLVVYLLAFIGAAFGILKKDKKMFFWLYSFLIVSGFLFLCKYTNFLYVRFLPFLYMTCLLIAAEGISTLVRNLKMKFIVPVVVSLLVVFLLSACWVKEIPSWIRWNYSGLEGKSTWFTLKDIFNYMRDVKMDGRVDVEYGDYNYFGTPRVFEVMPMFTNKSVMEGLLFESSLTFPFFFYMQKTVSDTSWWPGFPIAMPRAPDMDRGLKIFRLYNIKYFIASSSRVRALLANNSGYRLEKSIPTSAKEIVFNFYRINEDSDYVEYLPKEPVLVVTDDYRPFSFKWIDTDFLDVPVVYSSTLGEYELERFRLIVLNKSINTRLLSGASYYSSSRFEEALKAAQPTGLNCTVNTVLKEEELQADVSCLNRPLLVKIPYFPNWQTDDAEKVYLASPSLMLVYPEKNHLRIYYGWTLADKVGWTATIVGLLIVAYSLVVPLSRKKPKKKT